MEADLRSRSFAGLVGERFSGDEGGVELGVFSFWGFDFFLEEKRLTGIWDAARLLRRTGVWRHS